MSSRIIKAKAYSNGEVAYLSWQLDGMIHGCLGFEITRIYPDDPTQNTILAAWVPFKGQSNPDWIPQNTSVWPVQKLSWRDVTLVKRRDKFQLRPQGIRVQYLIRPIVAYDDKLTEVKTKLKGTYTGNPVRLSYLDEGLSTSVINAGTQYGNIRATFTNGILATQWLSHALKGKGKNGQDALVKEMNNENSDIRKYLSGEVLNSITMLLDKVAATPYASLRMALYELTDEELIKKIIAIDDRVELILSNTSKDKAGNWDVENSSNRKRLEKTKVKKTDRYFNNARIGHNKFVIYLEKGVPKSVLMGSTNWTPNGLCAQSNNAAIIESEKVAQVYNEYWELLKADTALFVTPNPLTASTSNVQGTILRKSNLEGNSPIVLPDNTKITVWFSPNTMKKTVDKTQIPPDLSNIYTLMRKAEKSIFFAVFLPGRANDMTGTDIMTNIITEAISIGNNDKSVLVYGAISDPTAMPNYVNPPKKTTNNSDEESDNSSNSKLPTPTTYDNNNVHIVRAYNLRSDDLVGNFEAELYSAGYAIIHDKIIVIDPFSENAIAIFGSHNLGFKASCFNDENLIIIQDNQALVQAYAVHILDIFEHYRFRAIQQELHDEGKAEWDGFLSLSDGWLAKALNINGKGDLANYMC